MYERNLEAAGEVHIKANDIFGEDAVGSVVANASVLAVENEETLLDVDAGAALYFSEGWVYADITDATEVIELMGGEVPEVTTIKTFVGDLGEYIGYDPEEPIQMPFSFDDMVPYANLLSDVKATESNGELTVIYTVTLDDIVNIMLKVLQDEGEIPTDATSEELEAFRTQLREMISSVINITTAKLTIGVGADGFLSKLYVDVDIAVTIASEEESVMMAFQEDPIDHELHELDGFLHIDIGNMNQTVDVVLPDNLDSYTDIAPEEEPV